MEPSDFVHLHVHSHYSLLDGTCTVEKLVAKAAQYKQTHLALTDHGCLFGAVEFYFACRKAGITPIIGMEAYLAPGSRFEKKSRGARSTSYYHLVLLARNEQGYRNLLRLSSAGFLEGFYYKPRIDKELLAAHAEGLIATSACPQGEVNRVALEEGPQRAREVIRSYQEIFGPENFYLEVMDTGTPEATDLRTLLPRLSRETGAPLIATSDIHYLQPDDVLAHEVHLCIHTQSTLEDPGHFQFDTDQLYYHSPLEMAQRFGDIPEAVTNTRRLAERIQFELNVEGVCLPQFHHEGVRDNTAFLRSLCKKGFEKRYGSSNERARRRLEHELSVLERMGYVDYFLIVWDFIRFARERNIPVGPGRGSAAGSVVAYCLDITQLDPLKYDLLFERFLNEDRISLPDIDVDFCMERRGEVLQYVKKKYGKDRVSQIITFGTLAARQVIRDVGRVLKVPLKQVDAICKRIPSGPGVTLAKVLQEDPELRALAENDRRVRDLFSIAPKLEGLNRNAGTHAAGVVIGDRPLRELVPLFKAGEVISTQYPMNVLEKLGLMKMDFLALRTLTIIDLASRMVQSKYGRQIHFDPDHLDDRATYELLSRGEAVAVFQLESPSMRELLAALRPDRFEDLIALLALHRPGPMGSGMVQTYVRRKHGEQEPTYPHPLTAPLLKETMGVILYQEQVMRIANVLAGFSMNEADNLRKAMGKKNMALMAEYREKFVEGATARGLDRDQASSLFDLMEEFAKYGFNKSHSAAYAYLTYQTAYLKVHYPAEFMAAVLSSEMSSTEKVAFYLEECRRMGVPISGPDINASEERFTVRDGTVVYALAAVKNVGGKAVREILKCRRTLPEKRFLSLYHLCEEVAPHAVSRTVLENLVKAGAFDSLCADRARAFAAIEEALARGSARSRDRAVGQLSFDDLLAASGGQVPREESYPEVPPWSELQTLAYEKEVLGLYLSGHPLQRHRQLIRSLAATPLRDLAACEPGTRVLLAGRVAGVKVKRQEGGKCTAFLALEDLTGQAEAVAFDETYAAYRPLLQEDALVFLCGRVQERNERKSLICEKVIPLRQAAEQLARAVLLTVDVRKVTERQLFALKRVLSDHPGPCPVELLFKSHNEARLMKVAKTLSVKPDASFLEAVAELLGENCVRFRTKAVHEPNAAWTKAM